MAGTLERRPTGLDIEKLESVTKVNTMKYILTLLLTLTATAGPTEWLQEQRQSLTTATTKANAEYSKTVKAAQKKKKDKTTKALHVYYEALKKTETYWVKQGSLDNAVMIRNERVRIARTLGIIQPKRHHLRNDHTTPQPITRAN